MGFFLPNKIQVPHEYAGLQQEQNQADQHRGPDGARAGYQKVCISSVDGPAYHVYPAAEIVSAPDTGRKTTAHKRPRDRFSFGKQA
jgi:hypothetical protein